MTQAKIVQASYDAFKEVLKNSKATNITQTLTGYPADLPDVVIKWERESSNFYMHFSLILTVKCDYEIFDKDLEKSDVFTISLDYVTQVSEERNFKVYTERKKHKGNAAKFKKGSLKETLIKINACLMEFYGKSLMDFEKVKMDFEQYRLD
jgi:hypothetical protein